MVGLCRAGHIFTKHLQRLKAEGPVQEDDPTILINWRCDIDKMSVVLSQYLTYLYMLYIHMYAQYAVERTNTRQTLTTLQSSANS